MKVLGLHPQGHDTGACLITEAGIWAISEERLSRVKHDDAFPSRALAYVLREGGLRDMNEVDVLVLPDHVSRKSGKTVGDKVRAQTGYRGRLYSITHHQAHAASAFFASPFEDAAVLVVDAHGSPASDVETGHRVHYLLPQDPKELVKVVELQSFYRGHGARLIPIQSTRSSPGYRNGLGLTYAAVSEYAGFGASGSGKLMGLAPYGTLNGRSRPRFFEQFEGDVVVKSEELFRKRPELCWRRFFGTRRARDGDPLPDDYYAGAAAAVQGALEEAMLTLANHLHAITRSANLCLAGGVALNCPTNTRLLTETGFTGLFVQPASCDAGIALGCALYGVHVVGGREERWVMQTAALGRSYGEDEIRQAVEACPQVRATRVPDIVGQAAERLAAGQVLGWFQGGSELGPRALGQRSILCDPRRAEMKDHLNARVKFREGFRPFAPAVLAERCDQFFELPCPSPFMLLNAQVRPEQRHVIPAVTHVDGSARVQTVTREANGRFYDLLAAFEARTGVPVLLNTSFNVAGEPIVETPQDALSCFLGTEIDALVLGDSLVEATGPRTPRHHTERLKGRRRGLLGRLVNRFARPVDVPVFDE